MRNILLATAAISLFSVPAMAQTVSSPQWSGSVGYTVLDGDNVNLGAITGRVTARLHPNFAVEGEASIGVKDDDITVAGVNGSVEHDYDAALYAVGVVPVSPNLELFGRVGYGTTSIKADIAGVSAQEDGESVNYGVGGTYYLNAQNGLRADWTRRDFTDDNGGEIDTYGVSYVRRF
ncbi:porin family protein [Brevundimonas sp. TWP2-3-4b1]|uniref:porin family protein n=1 Tax=Brevundimonas sp. TWP2-3-4b1 TaxID=2804580 RepID=UPI003CF64451